MGGVAAPQLWAVWRCAAGQAWGDPDLAHNDASAQHDKGREVRADRGTPRARFRRQTAPAALKTASPCFLVTVVDDRASSLPQPLCMPLSLNRFTCSLRWSSTTSTTCRHQPPAAAAVPPAVPRRCRSGNVTSRGAAQERFYFEDDVQPRIESAMPLVVERLDEAGPCPLSQISHPPGGSRT
jgi:hypothetical protein